MVLARIRSPFASHGKLFSFLASLGLIIIAYPFLESHPILLNILVSIILISVVIELGYDKKHLYTALMFAVPAIVTNVLDVFFVNNTLVTLNYLLVVLFYAYVAVSVLRYVVQAREVTADLIFGAIAVYILIGFIFGVGYTLIEHVQPGSYTSSTQSEIHQDTMFYFSFTTLTTTGYGDVLPASTLARMAASFEMVIGPLYIAILVARLVNNYMRTA